MPPDATSCDFQAVGDFCGTESAERQSKYFRSARCKFYGVLGVIHHIPDTTHDFYRSMHRKLFADTRKMQVYKFV